MTVCTLILPVYNQVDFTRRCLASIFRHTDVPYDLVIVDNGSGDGTGNYLARLQPATSQLRRLEVVRNPANRGVARAWNQGLQAAAGSPAACLLNNDTLVTPCWLSSLLGFLAAQPEAGIVSPHVTDGDLPGGMPEEYEQWACRHVMENWEQVEDGFHGCCFVLSSRVVDQVGWFDERFEVGLWEDVDYCHRARLAGFAPQVTHRAVIHHFGSKTVPSVVTELGGRNLYMENLRRFTDKWGIQLGRFTVSRSTFRPLD